MATDLSKPFPPVVGKPGRLCTRSLWAEREPQWWLIGPIDGLSFTGFCEWLLAPALHPGDLVVMDNLSSHQSASVRSAIEAAGVEVVLLPSGPEPDRNGVFKTETTHSITKAQNIPQNRRRYT